MFYQQSMGSVILVEVLLHRPSISIVTHRTHPLMEAWRMLSQQDKMPSTRATMVLRGQNNKLLPWPPKSPNLSPVNAGLTGLVHEGPKSHPTWVKFKLHKIQMRKMEVKRSCALYKEGGKEVKKVTWMDQEWHHLGAACVRASGEARLVWTGPGGGGQ